MSVVELAVTFIKVALYGEDNNRTPFICWFDDNVFVVLKLAEGGPFRRTEVGMGGWLRGVREEVLKGSI